MIAADDRCELIEFSSVPVIAPDAWLGRKRCGRNCPIQLDPCRAPVCATLLASPAAVSAPAYHHPPAVGAAREAGYGFLPMIFSHRMQLYRRPLRPPFRVPNRAGHEPVKDSHCLAVTFLGNADRDPPSVVGPPSLTLQDSSDFTVQWPAALNSLFRSTAECD
jgi:hypothetical protein